MFFYVYLKWYFDQCTSILRSKTVVYNDNYSPKALVMKALLISLFWICGSMGLKAQSYDPFPTSNAVWHALGFQYPFDMDEDYYHEMYSQKLFIDGDTLIGEQTWNKIYFSNQYLGNVEYRDNANYIAAIRENEHKQILAQFPDYPEFVLYDFSLDVGDTIYYDYAAAAGVSGTTPIALYRLDSPHYKVVVGKDSVQLETGEYRNQLILHSFLENYGNIHADNYWVEGLGCTNWTGLFNPLVVFFADNGDHLRFACFLHHEEVVYLDNPFVKTAFAKPLQVIPL